EGREPLGWITPALVRQLREIRAVHLRGREGARAEREHRLPPLDDAHQAVAGLRVPAARRRVRGRVVRERKDARRLDDDLRLDARSAVVPDEAPPAEPRARAVADQVRGALAAIDAVARVEMHEGRLQAPRRELRRERLE